jgi:hypothetical protein
MGIMLLFWAGVGALYYWYSLKYFFRDDRLISSFDTLFRGRIIELGGWVLGGFKNLFSQFLNFPVFLAAVFFSLGVVYLWRKKRYLVFFMLAPVILTIMLAVLRKYPFGDRTNMFLVPNLILLIFAGLEGAADLFNRKRWAKIIVFLLAGVMMYPSVTRSIQQFRDPLGEEDSRPVVFFLGSHYRPTDALFFNNSAIQGLVYYWGYWGFPQRELLAGRTCDELLNGKKDPLAKYHEVKRRFNERGQVLGLLGRSKKKVVEEFSRDPFGTNPRTWVFICHAKPGLEEFFLKLLRRDGKEMGAVNYRNASLYLFDLSGGRD